MRTILITTLLILSGTTFLPAAVISDTNIALSNDDPFGIGADYALTVVQDEREGPDQGDSTSIWLNVLGDTISFVTTNIDEGSDWYSVSSLEEFSNASILGDSHQVFARVLPSGFESNNLTVGFGDFYLGVNTGNGVVTDNGVVDYRTVYGWVHLRNVEGTLSMIGSAVTYEGTGIIVGTTRVVPEPSSSALICCGLAIAFCRRRSGIR